MTPAFAAGALLVWRYAYGAANVRRVTERPNKPTHLWHTPLKRFQCGMRKAVPRAVPRMERHAGTASSRVAL